MGMAASQARFLNLTARKSNIEYEGQQINQQRTTLSNQSADLYNQMLTLQVPTPPSTQDYTKVSYTFQVPGSSDSNATISQITKDTNGTYTVTFSYSQTELGFPPCSTNNYSTVNSIDDTNHTGNISTAKGKSYNLNYIDPNNIPKAHQDAYDAQGYVNRARAKTNLQVSCIFQLLRRLFVSEVLNAGRARRASIVRVGCSRRLQARLAFSGALPLLRRIARVGILAGHATSPPQSGGRAPGIQAGSAEAHSDRSRARARRSQRTPNRQLATTGSSTGEPRHSS